MQYAMLIYEPPQEFDERKRADDDPRWGPWRAYHQALLEAGVYVGGSPLERPETSATTIRVRGGERRVQDGPYADTKEQLGGFMLLELPTLDAALEWAARCPAAGYGAVEVRPMADLTRIFGPEHGAPLVDEARGVASEVARISYARLVSYLSARSGDVSSAEDALSEAFVAALRTWPEGGIPSKPEAWLLHAARRRLIDAVRLTRTRDTNANALRIALGEAESLSTEMAFPDERLKLLFVCAHPAIDDRVHTPLMLQVVLGLDAAAIAAAFLTPAGTMGQRLSRAKAKIKETRIAFDVPSGSALEPRLSAVLEAIYAAYGHGWEDVEGADAKRRGLSDEAIWLARMLVELLPNEPEALGLLALMQYCEARRPARRTSEGRYVPISEQDTSSWDPVLLAEAERVLAQAATFSRPGRFQLEAAIQSAHVERARGGVTDWAAIALLYEGLVRVSPTFGALVGRAAAVAEARGAADGLALLDSMAEDALRAYQPYWAARAHFLQTLGRTREARDAFATAQRLTEDPAVRAFLQRMSESA